MRKRIAAYSWAIAGIWALRNHGRCAGYLPSVCCPPRVPIAKAGAALAYPLFPMILFDFPTDNPVRLGYGLICQEMEVCNLAALTLSANGSWPTVQGTLSIKTAFNGAETYVVDGRQLRVGGGQFLILNEGQRYSGFVEQSAPVESFSIFFRPGFFEEAFRVATTPTERLLDDPQSFPHGAISFIERMYDREAGVWPMLDRLRNQLHAGKPERTWLEEQFHQMAGALVGVQQELRRERQRIPMVRAATRAELHRRLSQGRDFIASSFANPITVADAARAAAVAPHHFLRLFRAAFGITPHQYLTRVRLRHAAQLLTEEGMGVAAACYQVGFESPSSFSLLFRRHFGIPPAGYRAAVTGRKPSEPGERVRE